ncbi:MAG: transcriptional repressor NrdR [Phycisphaerae bacterium]|nr:transcriptional repressor NrdR [Phycisphaerae bacterium]
MNCPFCSANNDKVIDSRESDGARIIRRRRECLNCHRRFTTYERFEQSARLAVVKRDGTRVPFSRENILAGVLAACGKRPIAQEAKERLAEEVEEELHREFDREVPSQLIGERVMAKLRDLDEVAYIRFASEYYEFKTAGELRRHVEEMASRPRDVKQQQRLF